jgi:hypothetical protein
MERGVWQLKRLTLRFCTADATSRGTREFLVGAALAAPVAGAGFDGGGLRRPRGSKTVPAVAAALARARGALAPPHPARAAELAPAPAPPPSLAAFAAANPHVAVAASVRANRAPLARAEYADGSSREVDLKNSSAHEVAAALQRLRDSASGVGRSFLRPVATANPSVQGVWDPSVTYEGFAMREARPPAAQRSAAAAVAAATPPPAAAQPAAAAPLA